MGKSIIEQDKYTCFLCGCRMIYREKHHVFGGPNRNLSEKYGLTVYLCPDCHRGSQGVHKNAEVMRYLHEIGQQAFERTRTRKEFMDIFGKNYRDEEPEKPANPVSDSVSGIIWLEEI